MRAELRDALEFLFSDSVVSDPPCTSLQIDVPRQGTVSAHLLLNGLEKGQTLRLALRHRGNAVRGVQWFRLLDVPVEVNTGPVGFVEKAGEQNPHVIRRAPFRVTDALEPIDATVEVSSPTMALRFHLPVPADARPGRHDYTLTIRCGVEEETLGVTAHVYRAAVPPAGRDSLPYTNWFSFSLMAERHGLKPWTEPHWRMIRRYADLMVHGRQNTFWCPLGDIFRMKGKEPVLDRLRLRRIVRTFAAAGMHFIEGGHVASRTGGEWTAPTFDVVLAGARATTVEGNAILAAICQQLMDEIERNGWKDRWIQHATDEPIAANANDYRILVGMLRKHMPGLPILDATMDPALAGSVNIWCPQAQEYQRHRDEFEAQRKLGDRVWFYTCCFPGGPWLNRLLDMELLRPALFGWGAALYQLDGFLHWGLNHYRPEQNPFEMSVVGHGGNNRLPAGDTHIVYPGKDGPWSSLRLEAQREGFEDFELLTRLRAQDGRRAERIIRKAFRGFDQYTKDVKVFRAARREMLQALSR